MAGRLGGVGALLVVGKSGLPLKRLQSGVMLWSRTDVDILYLKRGRKILSRNFTKYISTLFVQGQEIPYSGIIGPNSPVPTCPFLASYTSNEVE